MARDLSDLVAGNRRQLRRSTTRFVGVDAGKQNGIYYGRQDVYTTVSTTIQKRAAGSSDPWVDVDLTRRSGAVTIGGHELIAASAVDAGSTPANVLYGDDATDADRFDTALGNQLGSLTIDTDDATDGVVTLTSAATTSNGFVTSAFEVGVEDGDGDLLTSELYDGTSDVDTANDEIRFVVAITLNPTASGQGVFTDHGVSALADAVLASKLVFRAFPFSDQDDALDATLTDLPTETFRTQATTDLSGSEVVVVGRVTTSNTPSSGFPYTIEQVGVTDDTDTLVFASDNRPITVRSDTEFTAQVSVVVRN